MNKFVKIQNGQSSFAGAARLMVTTMDHAFADYQD
jgi:hypothetical protein